MKLNNTYFQRLIETSFDAIVLMDEMGKVIYQSPSTERISGYSLAEMQAMEGVSMIHPDDVETDSSAFINMVRTPGAILSKKHRIRHKDGRYLWIEGVYRNLLHDEEVRAIVYNYTDVTEKVNAELRQTKSNRELQLLHNVNDIILSGTDELQLYNDICKCIVVSGGYKLAWLCFKPVEDSELQIVEPVASYGAVSYLETITISMKDPVLSKGPTTTVLMTGEKVVANNIEDSDQFRPWLEKAQKYGIAAIAALPLFMGSGQSGALVVYADAVGAFDAFEVSILERIAKNMCRAVQSLRTKADMLTAKYMLRERVKELSTIYHLHKILLDDDQTEENTLCKIVNLLPAGWQYPDICVSKIEFDGKTCASQYGVSPVFSQQARINTRDGRTGSVEIIYTEKRFIPGSDPFLKEERELIETIAGTIESYFNRRFNQDALAKSEANFRSSFEYAGIGMAIVSLTGRWLRVNPMLQRMLGYTEQELRRTTFLEMTHPDHREDDVQRMAALKSGSIEVYNAEKRYLHKNGSVIWGNVNVSVVKNAVGEPFYFVAQIEDITARKTISDQLTESANVLQLFVEHSPAALAMVDKDMRYLQVSKRWIIDYGLTEKDIIGKSHYEIFPTLPQRWKDVHMYCLQGNTAKSDEDSFLKADGTLEWLRWEILPWTKATGEVGGLIMLTEVITEKKQVYDQLKKSEANLKSIFDNTQMSYLLMDTEFNVVAVNDYFKKGYFEQTGFSLDEGANFLNLLFPEKAPHVKKILTEVVSTSQAIEYETCYENKGKPRYFSVTVSPVLNGAAVIGVCMASIEITNRKLLEFERQKIVSDLIHRNKDLQEFAQMVSHNIRGPLATVMGLVNLIQYEISEEDKQQVLKGIGASAQILDQVVRELIHILNVRNEATEQRKIVSLSSVIEEIKHNCTIAITNSRASIVCDLSAADELFTIPSYIYNILYNVITNSLQYRAAERAPVIKVTTEKQGNYILINITDNGIGIDMQKYGDQIFVLNRRFFNTSEGKGLGLFMTKTQVDALNGSISLESKPDEGTTVHIYLPL